MIFVPLRTVPGLNAREHFAVRAKRVKRERHMTGWTLKTRPRIAIPCTVKLTRVSPGTRPLDDDNLAGALKGVRDAVAEWLRCDDGNRAAVRFQYSQKRGPWGVEIEFGPAAVGAQHILEFDP